MSCLLESQFISSSDMFIFEFAHSSSLSLQSVNLGLLPARYGRGGKKELTEKRERKAGSMRRRRRRRVKSRRVLSLLRARKIFSTVSCERRSAHCSAASPSAFQGRKVVWRVQSMMPFRPTLSLS